MRNIINLQSCLRLYSMVLVMFVTPGASANQFQPLCQKVADNDTSDLEMISISSPRDAKIDLNNDGNFDPVSCRRSSVTMICSFDDGVSGEHIGSVTDTGYGEKDYYYEDIFTYNGETFVRIMSGTDEFKAPVGVLMYTGLNKNYICSISGKWVSNTVRWHREYSHLKNVFDSEIPLDIAAPKHAPVELVTFERITDIEVTFGGVGLNVVRNYDYIDFNNDGVNEYIAEAIRVPSLESSCSNTHLVEVDKYGENDIPKSKGLYEIWSNVGQCGNKTFYFYFNNEFFIKTNNSIFTIHGDKLLVVAQRIKSFKTEKITY